MRSRLCVASMALFCGVVLISGLPSSGRADSGPSEEREEERRNGIEVGFTHTFQLLRTSPSEAEAGRSEHLLGFVVAYERTLIPRRLVLVVAKPGVFAF
jgi:hypothetical protein